MDLEFDGANGRHSIKKDSRCLDRAACADFGVNYISYDTVDDIVAASSYEWIGKLSVDDGEENSS
jgi:hypothetical protein